MRGNIIPIYGTTHLEELANLLNHLIATLSRHQTDGLEYGKRGRSRLPLYTFLYLKFHNKESGLHLEKYCQLLISKASQTNYLSNIMCQSFHNRRHFHEKYGQKT